MKIFTPEVQYGKVYNPVNTFHKHSGWPSVCIDERGVLYAGASSMRMYHIDPTGKNVMWISFNEGRTWTPPIIVNDSYADDRDVGFCYAGGGRIVMSYFTDAPKDRFHELRDYDFHGPSEHELMIGYSEALKKLPDEVYNKLHANFIKVSEDYGITWTEPIEIPVTCPHGPSLCADGRLVFMGKKYYDDKAIEVYTSFDGGYTWEHTGTVNGLPEVEWEHMHEPHVIELPNGRLLGAIRVHARNKEDGTVEPISAVYTTFSDDKGKTWTPIKNIGVDGYPPQLMVHSSGAVICSYSCRTPGFRSERACVSYDNGETWTEDYAIDHRVYGYPDMGYPCTVELPDGKLFTVYYQPGPDVGNPTVQWAKWRIGGAELNKI